jgi:hypothetical protein
MKAFYGNYKRNSYLNFYVHHVSLFNIFEVLIMLRIHQPAHLKKNINIENLLPTI